MKIRLRRQERFTNPGVDLTLEVTTIQFPGDDTEYSLEEIRFTMQSLHRVHADKTEMKPVQYTHYVLRHAGTDRVYVKEADFFEKQGGMTDHWGRNWKPVVADSIEDARTKA